MSDFLACPFCRALYAPEEVEVCPECEIALVPLRRLPPSYDALRLENAESAGEFELPPEIAPLPRFYLGRGRGLLIVLSTLLLGAFFTPWVQLERPDPTSLSGFDLAASDSPWLFGGAIGAFLLLPLVATRRNLVQMRGIRAIATLFSLLSLAEVLFLLSTAPQENQYFSYGLEFRWGLYLSAALSFCASITALRLGGSLRDLRDLPPALGAPTRSSQKLH